METFRHAGVARANGMKYAVHTVARGWEYTADRAEALAYGAEVGGTVTDSAGRVILTAPGSIDL